ncbi:MAG: hypothetical protein M1337_01715 [Actinobacteria bacterium]|nr:hypothetical protein [Actinomycetota bacterium]
MRLFDPFRSKLDCPIMSNNLSFDLGNSNGPPITACRIALPPHAVEIVVVVSVPPARVGVAQTATARAAEDTAFEVMIMGPLFHFCSSVAQEDVLDAIKEFLADQGFVLAFVLDPLVRDNPGVVGVVE